MDIVDGIDGIALSYDCVEVGCLLIKNCNTNNLNPMYLSRDRSTATLKASQPQQPSSFKQVKQAGLPPLDLLAKM
jgi:hypothetical protein